MWFNDTFTESATTLCTSHTSDSGGTWLNWGGGANPVPSVYTSFGGVLASGRTEPQVVRTSVIAPVADCVINAVLHYDSVNFLNVGVGARMNAGGTAGYIAVYSQTNTRWELYRVGAAFATTALANSSTVTYSQGDEPVVAFSVTGTGNSVVLSLQVNGATVATYTDTNAARITAAGYGAVWFNTAGASNGMFVGSFSGDNIASAATAITLSGPASGVTGVASGNFTIGADGTLSGSTPVTLGDGGAGGTWNPTSVTLSPGNPTATATYTPATSGSKTLTAGATGLSTGSAAYNATSTAATAVNLSGPGSGTNGSPSTPFTIAANGVLSSSVIVTLNDAGGGGAWSPATVTLGPGALSANATYTPSSSGTKTLSTTNNGGLTNTPTSLSYTSLAVAASPPNPPSVADRVKETSTSTSASIITLAGVAPARWRRFQDAFPVGTKNIPVLVEEQTGNEWMVAACTLTDATTLTVTAIQSSSNAGAAPTFGSGTKTVACVYSAKLSFKAKCIDLADYNVDPTFTVDSTPAIRQAVQDAYDRRIEKIIAPVGHFKLSSPLMGSGNCQVQIPQTREGAPNHSIYIEGVCAPNFEQQGLRNVPPPDNGTLFESTIAGTGTNPAVFGMEQGNSGDAWVWNYTNIGLSNLGIRTKVSGGANSMCAFNGKYAAQVALLDQLRIDTDMGLIAAPTPNSASCGIIMPPIDNHLLLNGGMVYISGYYTGVVFGEHTKFDSLIIIGAYNGVRLDAANHGSWIGLYSAEHVKNAIVVNGDHPLSIGHYDAEHNTSFSWGTFSADVLKVSGSRKVAIMRSTVVRAGVGYDDSAFVSNDPNIYRVLVGAGAN